MESKADVVAALRAADRASLKAAVDRLNLHGFVTDEEGLCIGKPMIKRWPERATDILRAHGYTGGRLLEVSKFFPLLGEIAALYDEDRMSFDEAMAELRRRGAAAHGN